MDNNFKNQPKSNINSQRPDKGAVPTDANGNPTPKYVYTRPEDYKARYQTPFDSDKQDPTPASSSRQEKGKFKHILIICSAIILIGCLTGIAIWIANREPKPRPGVEFNADGMTFTTDDGVAYSFPSDKARLGLKGNVKSVNEISEFSPSEKFLTSYNFDTNGFFTSTVGEGISYPNAWEDDIEKCSATYQNGFIRSSQAKDSHGKQISCTYEYRPVDASTINVYRKLDNVATELAMKLTFNTDGRLATRVEQPHGDVFIVGTDGSESFSSTVIYNEKILQSDSHGNWTKKQMIDYTITREIQYY
ncbi:MAG: hypothetical protein NC328_01975 [Muribaculum sp.]|nr:hypothetical protein [Muribaculum sp.]